MKRDAIEQPPAMTRSIRRGFACIAVIAVIAGSAAALLAMAPHPADAQDVWPAGPPLSLTEAVTRALASHPSVAAAQATREAAAATVREAESTRLPALFADALVTRFAEPMVVAPIHSFNPARPPAFDRSLVQANLSVDYTLFDGGARRGRIAGARALLDGATAHETGAMRALLAEVAAAYLRVASTRDILAARDGQVEALEHERSRAEQLLAQGRTARVTVLRANAARSAASAERVSAEAEMHVAERRLARLMGVSADEVSNRPVRVPASLPSAAAADRERWIASAAEQNADVARARSRLAAAHAAADVARSARLPAVRLGGRWVEYGSGAGVFTGEWQGGVQIGLPLFTGGARSNAVKGAALEASVARAELRVAELRVAGAVDGALAALSSAQARVGALTSAVAQYEEVARIERLALDSGAGLQSDYLMAEAELARTRAALTEARVATLGARVELALVTGELTPAWLIGNLESRP